MSPMQGSKISKPEDEEGGQRQEGFFFFFFKGQGLGFCSEPSTVEKIAKQADSSRPREPSSHWLWRGSRCRSCSRGFGGFQLLALTPRDHHTTPAVLTHNLPRLGPRGPTARSSRLSDSQKAEAHTSPFSFLTSQMSVNASPPKNVSSDRSYGR